jgi:hypothetical protein
VTRGLAAGDPEIVGTSGRGPVDASGGEQGAGEPSAAVGPHPAHPVPLGQQPEGAGEVDPLVAGLDGGDAAHEDGVDRPAEPQSVVRRRVSGEPVEPAVRAGLAVDRYARASGER